MLQETPKENTAEPGGETEAGLRGRLTWLNRFLSPSAIALKRLKVLVDRVEVTLPRGQVEALSYGSIKDVSLYRQWFWTQVELTTIPGTTYVLRTTSQNAALSAGALLKGNNRLSNVRAQWSAVAAAYRQFNDLLDQDRYITDKQLQQWVKANPLPTIPDPATLPRQAVSDVERDMLTTLRHPRQQVNTRNRSFTDDEIVRWKQLFDTVESNPLTLQQKLAVVQDEDNTLVLAGAGTGKTSTIIAKVAYLLQAGLARPEEILLLSFTRKSADEMAERIKQKLGAEVTVRTFHSLGLEIIGQVEGRKPSLSSDAEDREALNKTLMQLLQTLVVSDGEVGAAYQSFLTSNLIPYRSPFEFGSIGEYWEYLKQSDMRALTGERLRSYEEIEIANWLYLNGVHYLYERPYEADTATPDRRQYKPDFYYPSHGIYHEHFGIKKDGSTAPYINREKYNREIEWKRNCHREHGTILIETYSWMKMEGILLTSLERELTNRGVELNPLPPAEVIEMFREANYVNPLINLLSSFLSLFKGSCMDEKELEKRAQGKNYLRNQAFLKIFLPLLHAYEDKHRQDGEIDFHDMIRTSLEYVSAGKYKSRFRYILVDEFQDISEGRGRLLRSLRDQVDGAKLFCVGDDWQSIYRFAGSDVSLVTNFEQFFGYTSKTALDRTFRFNNKILECSSRFILKNETQLPKNLLPHGTVDNPAVELLFAGPHEEPYVKLLETISAEAPDASVFFIGRNKRALPNRRDRKEIQAEFPSLKIEFLTAHKSKGLEADYAIICGLKSGTIGFPTEISDDPLLNLLLAKPDLHEHGEERRLFYVALTRARKKVYLVADELHKSCFVEELQNEPEYGVAVFGTNTQDVGANCPYCITGRLIIRNGSSGKFAGCSNYPLCVHTQNLCRKCNEGIFIPRRDRTRYADCSVCTATAEICPQCNVGTLEPRIGKFSPFIRCTMYRSTGCNYTRSMSYGRD